MVANGPGVLWKTQSCGLLLQGSVWDLALTHLQALQEDQSNANVECGGSANPRHDEFVKFGKEVERISEEPPPVWTGQGFLSRQQLVQQLQGLAYRLSTEVDDEGQMRLQPFRQLQAQLWDDSSVEQSQLAAMCSSPLHAASQHQTNGMSTHEDSAQLPYSSHKHCPGLTFPGQDVVEGNARMKMSPQQRQPGAEHAVAGEAGHAGLEMQPLRPEDASWSSTADGPPHFHQPGDDSQSLPCS